MEENENENINKTNLEKKNEKIDEYTKRMGLLKYKFSDILEAKEIPEEYESIYDEYHALFSLTNSLKISRVKTWGETIASDGCPVDSFVLDKYEDSLSKFKLLKEQNSKYISPEEEANFKFPEIDFDSLKEEVQNMKSNDDLHSIWTKLLDLNRSPFPESTLNKLDSIEDEMWQIAIDRNIHQPDITQEAENTALVNVSKFAEIYGKAKGKIQEVFSKIASFIKGKSHDKNNDFHDIDK